jgi:SAM-dependent methyltransferase
MYTVQKREAVVLSRPVGLDRGTVAPDSRLWDREWTRAWKAHPENAWFAYEADVYLDRIGRRRGVERATRALKTDAFDEACRRRQLTDGLGDDVCVIDVSPRIAAQAARAGWAGVITCAGDVRRLPFAAASFDVVLSTSTLDHFDRRDEITIALTELRRVLADGGRLLVTLDNPANPILRLRQIIYGITGAIGGLIPFRMGLTLSRRALIEAAEEAGLEVCESGYLIHAPRVLAHWAGVWAARRHSRAATRGLTRVLRAIERVAHRLPTRRWSGHFIFVECRPRPTSAPS